MSYDITFFINLKLWCIITNDRMRTSGEMDREVKILITLQLLFEIVKKWYFHFHYRHLHCWIWKNNEFFTNINIFKIYPISDNHPNPERVIEHVKKVILTIKICCYCIFSSAFICDLLNKINLCYFHLQEIWNKLGSVLEFKNCDYYPIFQI